MTTPECSILVPVCDAAATLAVCLRSIARQSERRWECIVVDDGSRDDSLEIARAFAARDPRVRVLASEHRGIVGALNEGLSACRAPVVVRMDADDWMHRHRIEAQLSHVTDTGSPSGSIADAAWSVNGVFLGIV